MILIVGIGARELVVVAMCGTLTMVLQRFNIVSALKNADEGIKRAIICVLESAMIMTVVSATASVK